MPDIMKEEGMEDYDDIYDGIEQGLAAPDEGAPIDEDDSDYDDLYDDMTGVKRFTEEEAAALEKMRKERDRRYNSSYQHNRNLEFRWLRGNCYRLADEIVAHKESFEALSPEAMKFVQTVYDYMPKSVPPTLVKLFDGEAKIGKKVTGRQALERVYKGRHDMAVLMTRWRKQGIILEYEIDPEGGPLDATYTLKALPKRYPGADLNPEEFLNPKYKVE